MGKKLNAFGEIFKVIGALTVLIVIVISALLLIDLLVIQKAITFEETYRITSPDGKVDVIAMHYNAGATTNLTEMVYIVPAGHVLAKTDLKLDRFIPVFTAQSIVGENIRWLRDNLLQIQYETAQIVTFRNFIRPLPKDADYVVRIFEKQIDPPD